MSPSPAVEVKTMAKLIGLETPFDITSKVKVPRPSAFMVYDPLVIGSARDVPMPEVFTSSTPPEMPPFPSAVKLPTRDIGFSVAPVKTSPLVVKAYVPFRLERLYLPVGGGGGTEEPPLLQAASQRAAAATTAVIKRFIAHLARLAFVPASRLKPA